MNLTELSTAAQGTDLLTETISSRLVPTPVQSVVFAEKEFIDANTRIYESKKIKTDNKIAQIVGMRSQAKNITFEAKTDLKQITLDRSFETYNVNLGEWNRYDQMQKMYIEALVTAMGNKVAFVPSAELKELFNQFMRSEMLQLGLHFASRVFHLIQAKQNSLLSTGRWEYVDASIAPVSKDFGIIPEPVGVGWNDIDNSTPLKDLDDAIDVMQSKQQVPSIIFMGLKAAASFERNRKEVLLTNIQPIAGAPFVTTMQAPNVTLTRELMNTSAGFKNIGTYRQIPIYCITKQVSIPLEDGSDMIVETFDENAVSLVALKSQLGGDNFTDVYGNLEYFMGSENTEKVTITGREWFAYHGMVSSDYKSKDYFCESKHAPVIEDNNALYILNVIDN